MMSIERSKFAPNALIRAAVLGVMMYATPAAGEQQANLPDPKVEQLCQALEFGDISRASDLINDVDTRTARCFQGKESLLNTAIPGPLENVKLVVRAGVDHCQRDWFRRTPLEEVRKVYNDNARAVEKYLSALPSCN